MKWRWQQTSGWAALSSGEAEYYAIVKGGSHASGIKGLLSDVGVHLTDITMAVKEEIEIHQDRFLIVR